MRVAVKWQIKFAPGFVRRSMKPGKTFLFFDNRFLRANGRPVLPPGREGVRKIMVWFWIVADPEQKTRAKKSIHFILAGKRN